MRESFTSVQVFIIRAKGEEYRQPLHRRFLPQQSTLLPVFPGAPDNINFRWYLSSGLPWTEHTNLILGTPQLQSGSYMTINNANIILHHPSRGERIADNFCIDNSYLNDLPFLRISTLATDKVYLRLTL